ncbi:ricin-type beta-trefoil lectin domain protein [Nocardioides humilatus]|uniref:ricin-type beta-trefoil lectin domain protein n=1 Tax=Nocardioides humilatus TaxID=2607660 RepID=UPI00165EFAB7|nr:ricin-type beta-trefoil lectin domain protein [Nocardioides humilatus]
MHQRKWAALVAASIAFTAASLGQVADAPAAAADGPGAGSPWIVSLGDSYISGEAGRWAGNTGGTDEYRIDALGGTAYFDNAANNGETVNRCHRSKSAEIHIGGGVGSHNLACSGATTQTHWDDDRFKPGLDQYADANGNWGQTGLLREFAKTHNVKMVVVSIGGNDFGFADIVQNCVVDFLYSPSSSPDYCYDDNTTTSRINTSNAATVRTKIKEALQRVDVAMQQAGYSSSDWTLLLQNYPMPLERSTEARYGDSGYTAQSTGGCGFWRRDLDYANETMLPLINSTVWGAADDSGLTNIKRLDVSHAMDNHKLCQRGVTLAEDLGYSSPWANADVPNGEEWVNQIHTVSTANTNFFIQESLHPNYWGQLALRNCVRQAWNGGNVQSGACQPSYAWGKNGYGEPNMTFSSTYASGYQPPRRLFNIGGAPSKRCVDVPGNSGSSGTVLTLWDCHGGGNQNFTYDLSTKAIKGFATQNGLCWGLQNDATGWGTKVVMQSCNSGNPRQRWTLGANKQIVNDATGLCVDANGGGTGNGTQLLIWGCGGQANQQWWY